MEVNNKIRTTYVDQYCGAFPNSNWAEVSTQSRKTCPESPHKILDRSNGRIDNYDCCHKPRLLRFLCQNPNLTLLGSYHKAELYHFEYQCQSCYYPSSLNARYKYTLMTRAILVNIENYKLVFKKSLILVIK